MAINWRSQNAVNHSYKDPPQTQNLKLQFMAGELAHKYINITLHSQPKTLRSRVPVVAPKENLAGLLNFLARNFNCFFGSRFLGEPGTGVARIISLMYSREYCAYSSAIILRVEAPNCNKAQIFRDTSTGRILRPTGFPRSGPVGDIHGHPHAKGIASPMPASAENSIFL